MPVFQLELQFDDKGALVGAKRLDDLAKSAEDAQKSISSTNNALAMLKGLGAGLAGLFAISKIKRFTEEAFNLASTYETLGVVVQQVGQVNGYSAVEVDKNVSALRRMGIAGVEARKTMTQLLQAQVDITKTPALARIAQDAAVIGGTNSSEAFERLVHGIQSAQTDVLRTVGLNVNFEQSYAKLATQLGKNTDALSEKERVQARVNAVVEAGANITGTYEAALSTVSKQIGSLSRLQNDFMTDLGKLPLEVAKSIGLIEKYGSALDSASQTVLNARAKMLGISQTAMDEAYLSGGTQGARDLVENWEAARSEAEALDRILKTLSARGEDVSSLSEAFKEIQAEIYDTNRELAAHERWRDAVLSEGGDASEIIAKIEEIQKKAISAAEKIVSFRETVASLLSVAVSRASGSDLDAHVVEYNKTLDAQLKKVNEAYAKTSSRAKELKEQTVKDQISALDWLVKTGKLTEEEAEKRRAAFSKELKSLNSSAEIAGAKAETARKKWAELEAELNELTGTASKGATSLEKTNREIEDSGKKAGKSGDEIGKMKDDYAAAFKTNTLKEFNKYVLELEGNTLALRDIKIEEEAKKWSVQFSEAGMNAEEVATNVARLKSALEQSSSVKDAQTSLTFLKEFSDLSGNYSKNQEYQNKLIDEQAKLYRSQLAPELRGMVDEWERLRKLQEARDPLSGSIRGLRQYANEATDMAKGFESAWRNGFQTMENALTDFVTTGKLSFSDLANSIIADLARIAIRQSITGPLASGLSSALGILFGGNSMSAGSSVKANAGWGNAGYDPALGINVSSVPLHHTGGMVGGVASEYRSIPEALFHGAPRLHGGGGIFGHDEYPAVLLRGERVLNPEETRGYNAGIAASGGLRGGETVVNIYNNNSTAAVTQQTRTDNSGNRRIDIMVDDLTAGKIMTPGSATNKAIRTLGGVRQQTIRR